VSEIHLFLQQVRDRPVKFTASDFFTLCHSTLCSFIAAVGTYLISFKAEISLYINGYWGGSNVTLLWRSLEDNGLMLSCNERKRWIN
jgi:hypothetical protein